MPRTNMRDLSFATFNLLNLQTPGELTYGSTPPFPDTAAGREAYNDKIEWIASRIRMLDAEVIGFQELWNASALVEAFRVADLEAEYDIIARDAPGRGRPQVALAVRKGRHGQSQVADGASWQADFPEGFALRDIREREGAEEVVTVTLREFSRPILRATIQPEGSGAPDVQLFVAHLKSKGPARISFRGSGEVRREWRDIVSSATSHVRRVMEAGALRAILDDVMTSQEDDALSPVVVLGDLNDATGAVTTELISDQPTYRVMQKSRAGFTSDKGLYSVERLQQYRSMRDVYYTHIYKEKRESLDHIMVSEEFYDHSRKRRWSFREMEVINDHLNREEFKAHGATDHGLVRAYFDWNPMPEEIDVA